MTARYQTSQIQHDLLTLITAIDRGAIDFFVTAPIVLDLSADRPGFAEAVTDIRARELMDRHTRGELTTVSALPRPAYDYVRVRLKDRFAQLDREAVARIRAFLDDWRRERDVVDGQRRKGANDLWRAGIDVILPMGLRLGFDDASLSGL